MRTGSLCCISCLTIGLCSLAHGSETPYARIGTVSTFGIGARSEWGTRVAVGFTNRSAPYGRFGVSTFLQQGAHEQKGPQGRRIEEDRETGFALSAQRMWPVSYRWHPWIGVEAGYQTVSRVNRYSVERSGFLVRRLPERSSRGVLLGSIIDSEWRYSEAFVLGLCVQIQRDMALKATLLAVSVTARYRP